MSSRKYYSKAPPTEDEGWVYMMTIPWRGHNWQLWEKIHASGFHAFKFYSPDGARFKASYSFGWVASEDRISQSKDIASMEEHFPEFALKLRQMISGFYLRAAEVASK